MSIANLLVPNAEPLFIKNSTMTSNFTSSNLTVVTANITPTPLQLHNGTFAVTGAGLTITLPTAASIQAYFGSHTLTQFSFKVINISAGSTTLNASTMNTLYTVPVAAGAIITLPTTTTTTFSILFQGTSVLILTN